MKEGQLSLTQDLFLVMKEARLSLTQDPVRYKSITGLAIITGLMGMLQSLIATPTTLPTLPHIAPTQTTSTPIGFFIPPMVTGTATTLLKTIPTTFITATGTVTPLSTGVTTSS